MSMWEDKSYPGQVEENTFRNNSYSWDTAVNKTDETSAKGSVVGSRLPWEGTQAFFSELVVCGDKGG